MTDLLVGLATHALAGFLGWRAYRFLDARWETEEDYELPAFKPPVRVIQPVVDWQERGWA